MKIDYSFTVFKTPWSFNGFCSLKKRKYIEWFSIELGHSYKNITPTQENLYGLIYYFRAGRNGAFDRDADNLSKPVWDSLNGILYDDDKQIVHRRASIIEMDDFNKLNIANMKKRDKQCIQKAVDKDRDIFYIEVGSYHVKQIEFNVG